MSARGRKEGLQKEYDKPVAGWAAPAGCKQGKIIVLGHFYQIFLLHHTRQPSTAAEI
jgi:hypothetical protein